MKELSRRTFLRQGAISVCGLATVSPLVLFTSGCGTNFLSFVEEELISAMPWLRWDTKQKVVASFSWFVNRYGTRILKKVWDDESAALALAEELGLKKTNSPSPTVYGVHNSHAESYIVTNRHYHQETYSRQLGCCIKLDHYLRCGVNRSAVSFGDLSALEIDAIAVYERYHQKMLLPSTQRYSSDWHPMKAYPRSTNKFYTSMGPAILRDEFNEVWEVKYTRTFTAGNSPINGYGLINQLTQKRLFYFPGEVRERKSVN